MAWLARRLSSVTSVVSSGGVVVGEGLKAQEDCRERLVHLVVEVARDSPPLLFLRAQHELARAHALVVHPLQNALERVGKAIDLLDGVARDLEGRRLGGVDPLDSLDQVLEGSEAR